MDKINYDLLASRFEESQLSQYVFAEQIGVTQATISNVLTGRNYPSYPVATRIVDGLELTKEEIIAIFFPYHHAKHNAEDYTRFDHFVADLSDKIRENYFEKDTVETKNIFSVHSSMKENADLFWKKDGNQSEWKQVTAMGYAYLDASFNLVMLVAEKKSLNKMSALIFPALFTAVCGVENYAKGLIGGLKQAMGDSNTALPCGYKINKLIFELNERALVFAKAKLLPSHFKKIERISKLLKRLVNTLYVETEDKTFARFPPRRQHKTSIPHFYVDKNDYTEVDLEILLEYIVTIFYIFSYLESLLDEYLGKVQ